MRYPYVRGSLLRMWREARHRRKDPVATWAKITGDPDRRRAYQRARGKGGFVRASWDEGADLVAAARVHTIKTYGPDQVARCATGLAAIGLGQHRPDGYAEPPLLTLGQDFGFLPGLPQPDYTAADVVRYLLGPDHQDKLLLR